MFHLRCQDGNAVICIATALNQQELHGHTQMRISIFIQTPLSNALSTFCHGVFLEYHMFPVCCEDDDAVLYCNSGQTKRSRGYKMEMWKSVLIQTPNSSTHPFLVIKSLCYTWSFNCAARTATLFHIATALNRKESRGRTLQWISIAI